MKPKIAIAVPTIEHLFAGDNLFFVIPAVQRPYSWDIEDCAELWRDIISFAFPHGRAEDFDRDNHACFIGSVVLYNISNQHVGVIDGQQRITTLLLLMRALYDEIADTENGKLLAKCVWLFGEDGMPIQAEPRIETHAVLERDKLAVRDILISGKPPKKNAVANRRLSDAFLFFKRQIFELKQKTPDHLNMLAGRLVRNVYFVQIATDSESSSVDHFVTLNTKGKPLNVEDIFLAKIYEHLKHSKDDAECEAFVSRWKELNDRCVALFDSNKQCSQLEYPFYLVAKADNPDLTVRNLLQHYRQNDYALLKSQQTLPKIHALIDFFEALRTTQPGCFVSPSILTKAHLLFRVAKNSAWLMLATFFFRGNFDGNLKENERLENFLNLCVASLLRSAITGTIQENSYANKVVEMSLRLINGEQEHDDRVGISTVRHNFAHFPGALRDRRFADAQRIIATWWVFKQNEQALLAWNVKLQMEHIVPKSALLLENFGNPDNVELPGNLALLSAADNRKAGNRSFDEKRKIYAATKIHDLAQLAATHDNFSETDILERNQQICDAVISTLDENGFLTR